MPRKFVYYLAASADGFIARPDGDVAWLDHQGSAGDYGMTAFYRAIDTVLMGRKTWERGLALGQTHFPGKKNYVFSKRRRSGANVEFVRDDVPAFAKRLRKERGKDVWICGGSALFGSFLDAGQVDEIVVHLMPVLIGEGIPLVAPRHREIPLHLLSSRRFADGVVRLRYAVRRSEKPALRVSSRASSRR